jgi:catechol 2,3-dioxygenase
VTHAVLLTTDVEGLARFYREVGGLAEVHRDDGIVYLRGSLDRYPYNLVLCRKEAGEERRYHHVSFELESEEALDAAERALGRLGIEPAHVVDSEIKRSFFLEDPDGMLSEYYVRRASGFPDLAKLHADARPLYA